MNKSSQFHHPYFLIRTSFLFLLFVVWYLPNTAAGQVNSYTFSQTNVAYSPITGGTVLATATGTTGAASLDDVVYTLPAGTIPFSFNFNFSPYTGFNLSTNGFVTFGATAPAGSGTATGYAPLSATTAYSGAVSALGRNLNAYYFAGTPAQTGEIRYQTLGASPSRVFVIQFSNFKTFNTSGATFGPVINFQIRLYETTNVIDIVYNLSGAFASTIAQVGLRGATNSFPADINNRAVAAGTNTWATSVAGNANNATCEFSATLLPAAGLTYRFTPNNCPPPTGASATNITQSTAQLVWTAVGGSGTYRVEYGLAGFVPGTGTVLNGVASGVMVSGLNPASAYHYYVRQVCGGGQTSSTVGPVAFSTASAGEDCATAQLINVASSLASCVFTTVNSGLSANGPNALCSDVSGNNPNDDKWFRFIAPAGTSKLVITTTAGTVNDWVMEVWDGCPGSGGMVMKCADDVNASMPEITLCQDEYTSGQTYYVRLWTYSTTSTGSANLCVYQTTECPIPPINDECLTATRLTVYPFGGCPGGAITRSTLYATPTPDAATCDAGIKRDVWFVFNTGNYSAINMSISPITATTLKAQLLFECGGFELECYSPANGTYQFTALNPQADYVIRVWSDTLTAGTFSICLSGNCVAPTASLGPSQSICSGQTASVPVSFTGVAPYTLVYRNNSTGQNTTITTASNPYQLLLSPTVTTNYSLVSISDATGCPGTVNSSVTITVTTTPNITLSPFTPVCANAGLQTLSGGSPSGGVYSGMGVINNQFNPTAGTQTITYTISGSCGGSASQVFTVNPLPSVVLNSLGSHCSNATPFALSGGTPSGGTYSGPGVTSNIFNPVTAGLGNHIINYSYTSAAGCTNSDTSLIRVISCGCTNPATANAGPDQLGCGTAAVSINGSIGGGATTLTWSGGTGNYSPGVTSANINYTPSSQEINAGFARLILTTNDPDGSGPCLAARDTVIITISPNPSIGSITGSASVCRGQSGISYSVTAQAGITYTWTVPVGVTITSGQGTNAIMTTFSTNAVSGAISLTASNSCGTDIDSLNITVSGVPILPVVSGSNTVCRGQGGVAFSIISQTGVNYVWSVPAGVTITSGQGSVAITTTWGASAVSGNVSVTLANLCGSASGLLAVTASSVPATPVITGQSSVCTGSTGLVYTTPTQTGSAFSWVVPSGAVITAGQGANSITTAWSSSAVSGNVIVSATNGCGTTSGSYPVSVTSAPVNPVPITGPAAVCRPLTGVSYSVSSQSGVTYSWAVPSGVTISSGQGTSALVTSWSASAASGNVTVTITNSCGSSSGVIPVTASSVPTTPVITGQSAVCEGSADLIYTTTSQAGSVFTWTVPSGVLITAGQGINSISTDWSSAAVSGSISVSVSNGCGTTGSSYPVTVTSAPLTPGQFSGPTSVCRPSAGIAYSIGTQTGVTYNWVVPSGVTITSGQGTGSIITSWSASASSGNITVTLTNSCGSSSGSLPVLVSALPAIPVISGQSTVCSGSAGLIYTTTAQPGSTFIWTVPSGVIIASGQGINAVSTDWSASAASGNIAVSATNGCGTTNATFPVTVTSAPLNPGQVTGSTSVCRPASGVGYSVASQTGVTYNWLVPAGVTITSGQGTGAIVTSWAATASSGNVSVSLSNSCGSASAQVSVATGAVPTSPTVAGQASVCAGSSGLVYTTTSQAGTTFIWTVPGAVTITAGQGINSITTNWGTSSVSGTISVAATNGCGTTSASYPVTVGTGPGNPGAVSGPSSVCRPSAGVAYSVSNQPGVTFSWTVPSGVTITSGQGSNTITTSWGAASASGNIAVTATNSCGTASTTLPVSVTTGTVNQVSVSGPASVCRPSAGVVYSVNNQAGVVYSWTVPAGVTIVSGQGSNSITTTWSTMSVTGSVTVSASNGCDTVSGVLPVAVATGTVSLGAMIGPISLCAPASGVTYSVNNQPGVTYTWVVPVGVTIISGQGSNSITTNWLATAVSGSVSVTATDLCGTASATTLISVVTGTVSPGSVTGVSPICRPSAGLVYSVNNQTGVTYNWVVPAGVTISSGQGSNSITTSWGAASATGTVTVTATNICGSSISSLPVSVVTGTANPGTIAGSASLCTPSSGNAYSVNNQSGVTYNWVVPSGVTIVSGQGSSSITTSWSASSAPGNITVTATNICGTISSSLPVAVTSTTVNLGSVSGPSSLCRPSTGVVFSVNSQSGVGYAWVVPPGVTITSGQGTSSISTSWSGSSTTSSISVTGTTACNTTTATRAITVITGAPAVPGSIGGSVSVCPGDSGIYRISRVSNADYYVWTPRPGMTINGSALPVTTQDTAVSVVFLANFSTDTLKVQSGNCFGLSAGVRTLLIGRSTATAGVPVPVSGRNRGLCGGGTFTFSLPTATAGAVSYTWRIALPGALINGLAGPVTVNANTLSISVTLPATWTGITALYVKSNNACGSSSERMLTLAAAPAIPGSISGPSLVCSGSAKVGYSVSPVPGASSYNWMFPQAVTLVGGQGTTNIRLNFNATAGIRTIRVAAYNSCGTSSARSLNVNSVSCLVPIESRLESVITGLTLYPNPAQENTTLEFHAKEAERLTLSIYDLSGRSIQKRTIDAAAGTNRVRLDLVDFPGGVYMLELLSDAQRNILRLLVE